jgi:OOP family OmpA-OmpF porin
MKKLLFSLIALGFIFNAHAQVSNGGMKKTSIAIRYNALDFGTAKKVQNGSIGSVLNDKKWGQMADVTNTFGVNYTSQYDNQIDLYTNVDIAITRKPDYSPSAFLSSTEYFYASVETGLNIKMFKGDYPVNPFVSAGLGVRSYALRNYSAYAPVGLGLQIKSFKGSNLNVMFNYSTKMSKSHTPSYNYGISYSFPLK